MKSLRKTLNFLISLSCFFNPTFLCSCAYVKNFIDTKNGTAIPKNYLKISDDGKTLYGLSDSITIRDIVIEGYDTLSIPEEITKIESYAFAFMFDHRTPSITKIELNDNLEEIGDYAFFKCSGIDSINFDKLTKYSRLAKIGSHAFSGCKLSGDIHFPISLIEICDCAFDSGIDDAKIIIPSSVQKVGSSAFKNCNNIKTLNLSQYQSIPDWLYDANSIFYNFAYNQSFNLEIFVDTSINTLGQWQDALFNYQSLPNIGTVIFPQKEIRVTPSSAFVVKRYKPKGYDVEKLVLDGMADGYKLEDYDQLVVPDGVEVIGTAAFSTYAVAEGAKLTVVFPSSLECIQDRAFESAHWLVSFPDFLSYCKLGSRVFQFSGIGGILDLSSFSEIGEHAFDNCNFQTIKISPNTIITEKSPFDENPQIETIDLTYFNENSAPPDLERGIDQSTYFEDVFTCGKILWPGKMSKMDKWNEFFAKTGFTGLETGKWISIENVTEPQIFPDSSFVSDYNVRNIYGFADDVDINEFNTLQTPYTTHIIYDIAFANKFISDDKFWTLKLNNGLKTIGDLAFYNNPKLLCCDQFPNTIESIGIGAFEGDKLLSFDFRLPRDIKMVDSYAFYDCNNLWSTNLIIDDDVEKLGDYAFGNWKYVQQITIDRCSADIYFGHKTFTNLPDLHILDFSNITFCPTMQWWLYSDTFDLGPDSYGKVYVNGDLDDTDIKMWEDLLRDAGLTVDENHWKIFRHWKTVRKA